MASPEFGPLVDADWLAAHATDPDVRIIDMRWSLEDHAKGRRSYDEGHIPDAVFVDLEGEVTGAEGHGRHPLPTREVFEHVMRRAGVDNDDRVIVYDDSGGAVAARLWWLLHRHGHPNVAVLDGGMQTWTGRLEHDEPVVPEGNFEARPPDESDLVRYEDFPLDGVVIDVRAQERFRGELEPVDPIAGHIPGARNVFWQQNLEDGRFKDPAALRALYSDVRPGTAVVYCGSGVTSCHTAIALERAGLGPVRLYAGSWSDWSSRPGAPVATGSD